MDAQPSLTALEVTLLVCLVKIRGEWLAIDSETSFKPLDYMYFWIRGQFYCQLLNVDFFTLTCVGDVSIWSTPVAHVVNKNKQEPVLIPLVGLLTDQIKLLMDQRLVETFTIGDVVEA